jgi:hypothetical protein
MTRKTGVEFWISGERAWEKRGGQLLPYRPAGPDARAAGSILDVGFDYESEFRWAVRELSPVGLIGRACRTCEARGIAGYSETTVRAILCPADRAGCGRFYELPVRAADFRLRGISGFLFDLGRKHPGQILLSAEEATEHAIAPLMKRRVAVTRLDQAPLPAEAKGE